MEKRLSEMCNVPDKILALLQSDVAEIKVALLGNEYNPSGGLLCRATELEKEVVLLKEQFRLQQDKFNRIVWTGIGAGTGISFVWMLAIKLMDILAK